MKAHVPSERHNSLTHAIAFDKQGPPSKTILSLLFVNFYVVSKGRVLVLISIETICLMRADGKEEGDIEKDGF